ncbi:MAG: rRNA maturation RNase YbeY [Gammaproteobacteria bacterium]|jgi:probable rRNA maturation factor
MSADTGIDIQYAVSADGLPAAEQIREWVRHVLRDKAANAQLTVRIVDTAEITALNERYRRKDGPTNVLSFPYEPVAGVQAGLLGDIVICAPVVMEEAVAQQKPLEAHWAHMVVHGLLHLLGYDHRHDLEADEMEEIETALLNELGFSDPYG